MCVVCTLFNKDKLTIKEAKKALWETVLDENEDIHHIQEFYAKLEKLERQQQDDATNS